MDADGGRTYCFITHLQGKRAHRVYVSKDWSRIIEEVWSIKWTTKGEEKFKLYRSEKLNGIKDGVQETYDDAGRLIERATYVAGVQTDCFINNTIVELGGGQYKNGKKDGKWKYDYGTTCTEITYSEGKYNGPYEEYIVFEGKKELIRRKNYAHGNLSGICERFINGVLSKKIGYVNGQKDGMYVEYALDGKTPVVMGQYSKGEMIGGWTYYLKDNLVDKIENYKDGKKHGICKTCYYRPSKQYGLEIDYFVEENYVNGLKEGEFPYEEFDSNGELVLKGSIIDKKREGIWNHYKNNELILQDYYANDELVASVKSNIPPVKSKEFVFLKEIKIEKGI